MDNSKFNINANVRAKIREKFLKSYPEKQTKDSGCDETNIKTETIPPPKKEEPVEIPNCGNAVLYA